MTHTYCPVMKKKCEDEHHTQEDDCDYYVDSKDYNFN